MLKEWEDWALQESGLSLNSVREMSVGCNGFIKEFASSPRSGMAAQIVLLSVNSGELLFIERSGERTGASLRRQPGGAKRSVEVQGQTGTQQAGGELAP